MAGVAPETSLTLAEADRMLSALAAKGHLTKGHLTKGHLTKGHLTKGHLKVRVAPGRLLYSLRGGDARL